MIMSFYIGGGHTGSTTSPPVIGSVAAADSCMLALDYAQNKVGYIQKYYDLLISLGIPIYLEGYCYDMSITMVKMG